METILLANIKDKMKPSGHDARLKGKKQWVVIQKFLIQNQE